MQAYLCANKFYRILDINIDIFLTIRTPKIWKYQNTENKVKYISKTRSVGKQLHFMRLVVLPKSNSSWIKAMEIKKKDLKFKSLMKIIGILQKGKGGSKSTTLFLT